MKKKSLKLRTITVIGLLGIVFVAVLAMTATKTHANLRHREVPQDHYISLAQAVKLVGNFRNNPTAPNIKGGSFDKIIFESILSQPGCIGIRYYYAKKDDGSSTMVLVGVDAAGNDMTSGVLGDDLYPCPPVCGAPNDLNK